jgi:hypothetical protein
LSDTAFDVRGYELLPALIEPALTEFLWSYVNTKFASRLVNFGDRLMPKTPGSYGDPAFDGLLEFLRPQIEAASGRRLFPTYSYFRLYKRGDVLPAHRDRPACEFSLTLNLGQVPDAPWPIFVQGEAGPFGAWLGPGDALLYRGPEIRHWREPYAGERLVQVFLHYVDRDGPNAGLRYDGRESLMRQEMAPADGG